MELLLLLLILLLLLLLVFYRLELFPKLGKTIPFSSPYEFLKYSAVLDIFKLFGKNGFILY